MNKTGGKLVLNPDPNLKLKMPLSLSKTFAQHCSGDGLVFSSITKWFGVFK